MKIKIESILHDMIGKTYMYKNNNIKVLRYKLDDITATIITDTKDIPFLVENASEVLSEFLIVDDRIIITHKQHSVPDSIDDNPDPMPVLPNLIIHKQSSLLSDIIMQNIKDIQNKPTKENLAKAAAVNDQVKSMLDICKIEVEAMKVAAYVNKSYR